jgi:hypothetical protein
MHVTFPRHSRERPFEVRPTKARPESTDNSSMRARLPVEPEDPNFDASGGAYAEAKVRKLAVIPNGLGPGSKAQYGMHGALFVAAARSRLFNRDPRCKIFPIGGTYEHSIEAQPRGRDSVGTPERGIRFPDSLPRALHEWRSGGCRLAFVPFGVIAGRTAHAVVACLDRLNRTVDLFDPEGMSDSEAVREVQDASSLCIASLLRRSLGRTWEYRGIRENTPVTPGGAAMFGPQHWDRTLDGRRRATGGNCVYWCLLYSLERSRDPEASSLGVATALSLESQRTGGANVLGMKTLAWRALSTDLRGKSDDPISYMKASSYPPKDIMRLRFAREPAAPEPLVTIARPSGGLSPSRVAEVLFRFSVEEIDQGILHDPGAWKEFDLADLEALAEFERHFRGSALERSVLQAWTDSMQEHLLG